MDALNIVYPQYWSQPKHKKRFNAHLAIIKTTLYQPKQVKLDEVWVPILFSTVAFDLQKSLFMLNMTNNAKLAM
jgi:hypothetical protein